MAVWVLAADASRARIFQAVSRTGALDEVQDLVHPASHLREQELVSDAAGRARHGPQGGGSRHSVGHEDDAPVEEQDRFARQVAGALRQGREAGHFDRLHILAAPRFLGMLRKHLDRETRALVVGEQDLDLTARDTAAIRAHLPDRL